MSSWIYKNFLVELKLILVITKLLLRYFDKLTNFFASTYVNSPKHNSNFLSYLRIFFERNNKYKSTFAKLGNVFRNSKWSDLKVQNIKTPLISNWLSWFITVFLLILLISSFFGNSTASQIFVNVPFITDGLDAVFYIWANFLNFVSLAWMQVWLTLVAFKLSILRTLGLNQNYMYKAFNMTSSPNPKINSHRNFPLQALKLSPNSFYDNESITLVYHLSRVNKSLVYLNNHYTVLPNLCVQYNPIFNKMYSLMPDVITTSSYSNVRFQIKEISNHTLLYTLNNSLTENWGGLNSDSIKSLSNLTSPKFYTINNNVLQTLNNQQFGIILNNLNIYNNLNQAKQDRWLLKNSLLSNSSTVDLNAFTQTKKLIGMNLFESTSTSRNIWNSSKMTQLTQTEELQKLSLLQNFLGFGKTDFSSNTLSLLNESSSGLQGFNWFETSSLWTTKKFFFTNQLKFNHTNITTNSNYDMTQNTQKPNTVFNFSTNLFNTNFNTQMSTINSSVNITSSHQSKKSQFSEMSLFLGTGDEDLLKSFNLNVINTLTLPLTDKDSIVNNYILVKPLTKKKSLNFKK
jgi:hypothetical protein